MQLSEDILGSVVWSLAPQIPGTDEPIVDARRRFRSPARGFVTIYFGNPGVTRNVAVYDISADGISIFCPSPMRVNDQFILTISKKAKSANVICRVMHCSQEPDHYRIGASFISFV